MVTVTINRNGNTKTHTYKRLTRYVFNRVVQTVNAEVTVTFKQKWGGDIIQSKPEFIENWIAQQELIDMGKGR